MDSRYESLVDEIAAEIEAGRYPMPPGFREKYENIHPGVVGSGSNGRIFRSKEIGTGNEVAVKLTLAMYGATQELAMLKRCTGPFVVRLMDNFTDGTISILVMEMGGTPWTRSNPVLKHLNLRDIQPSRRVNISDMYGCMRAHGPLEPGLVRKLFRGVVEAIIWLHGVCGVSHGDLKVGCQVRGHRPITCC